MINRSVVWSWAVALVLITAFWSAILFVGIRIIGRFW